MKVPNYDQRKLQVGRFVPHANQMRCLGIVSPTQRTWGLISLCDADLLIVFQCVLSDLPPVDDDAGVFVI